MATASGRTGIPRPGDAAFIDSYPPHAPEPNRSARIRRLYFATHSRPTEGDQPARCHADKRKDFPPDIEREAGKEYVYRVWDIAGAVSGAGRTVPRPEDRVERGDRDGTGAARGPAGSASPRPRPTPVRCRARRAG